ncbi:MAG: cytochrome P450 [Myxococcales bacterium]|nr:cytochrome P450 [Myxococcales bacterium]
MALSLDTIEVHSPKRLFEEGYPWADWDLLRREAPVFWYERPDVEPFWAITKHADVQTVSRRSDIFINGGPRLRLTLKGQTEPLRGGLDSFGKERGWDPDEVPDFVFMDDPRHRKFRSLSSRSFTPGRLRQSADHFHSLAEAFTAHFVERLQQGPCDFVSELAVKLPVAAICEMMKLPESEWEKILVWTNAIVGDVEDIKLPGEGKEETMARAMNEFRAYLEGFIAERKAQGASEDALVDSIVGGKVDGHGLTDQQLIGYLMLIIGAGNETTRNATSGGVIALLENPEQRDRFCADESLLDSTIEEILRWTSPVYQFLRTATEDYELRGQRIKSGDTVCVFYGSANRDEDVFDDPYRFDIGRSPNPHLAFGGYGAHFCLGANLARAELRAALTALRPVLPKMELAGKPVRNPDLHVPGYVSVPVRATG